MTRLAARTGLFLEQDFLAGRLPAGQGTVSYGFERLGKLAPNEDESSILTVSADKVTLAAPTDVGIGWGFETLLQLLSADEQGYYFPCGEVRDKPRFTWRGLLIDAGRHFMPVDVIKRNLDGMAAVKLNVLHWHLTEDQGFRVESRIFPRLHQLGSDGQYYTQDQIRDIIAYASDRGIRVMPEFDIPGHSTSWLVAFPELASSPGPFAIERHFGVFGGSFNPIDERVYRLLDRFLAEMASLFPDPYLHIGGDEVEGKPWDANPAIQAYKKKNRIPDNHALQAVFNKRLLKILQKHGKRMVGWDEIFQPGLPTDIVIHSWRGTKALVEAAQKGYQGLLSNGYYIDLCQPAEFHYLNDPLPADSPLTEAQKKLVLGGEATMWAELVSPETVDSRIWPRTAAIAERLWSPATVRHIEDMYRRLRTTALGLEEVGLTHFKNQDMLLRRLAGTPDIRALKVLAEAAEPLKTYQRHSQGVTYTSHSPLTRFVDALAPESLAARAFRLKADRFLETKDPQLGRELRASFLRWKGNHPSVLRLLARSPALLEIEGLSLALAETCETGLAALEAIAGGETRDDAWVQEKLGVLAAAKKPKAHAELAVVTAVEKLVQAAAGKS
jgi:hexosaminidase